MLRKSCEICQIEVDELVSHMEFVHSVKHYQDSDNEEELPESITCDECDEVFIKKCDLIRHRMKHIMINQKAIYVGFITNLNHLNLIIIMILGGQFQRKVGWKHKNGGWNH